MPREFCPFQGRSIIRKPYLHENVHNQSFFKRNTANQKKEHPHLRLIMAMSAIKYLITTRSPDLTPSPIMLASEFSTPKIQQNKKNFKLGLNFYISKHNQSIKLIPSYDPQYETTDWPTSSHRKGQIQGRKTTKKKRPRKRRNWKIWKMPIILRCKLH